jgi:DNA mismatch endonuclease (patch repair protein)
MPRMSKTRRHRTMSAIRSRDTAPELTVRDVLRSLRYRSTCHVKDLPGTPDIVLRHLGKAILVHGCFWHQHSHCALSRKPIRNLDYWEPKFARIKARDRASMRELRRAGWRYLVVWECETADREGLTSRIRGFLRQKAHVISNVRRACR